MKNEKRKENRALFEKIAWNLGVLLSKEALEKCDFKNIDYIAAWDISPTGASFMTNVSINLNSYLDILISDSNFNTYFVNSCVCRVDQIKKMDDPIINYKIVVKFKDIDENLQDAILGVLD